MSVNSEPKFFSKAVIKDAEFVLFQEVFEHLILNLNHSVTILLFAFLMIFWGRNFFIEWEEIFEARGIYGTDRHTNWEECD